MLFGLQVSAKKRYSKLVDIPFEVSNITLSPSTTSTARATLVVRDGKDEFAICSLTLGKIENFSTSLHFPLGSEISFSLEAPEGYDGVFHLTGQYIDEAECDEDFDSEEGEDFDSEEGEDFDFEDASEEDEDSEEEEVVEELIDEDSSDAEMPQEPPVPEPKRKKDEPKANNQKMNEPKQKQEQKMQPKQQDQKPKQQDQSERTLGNGLKIKDLIIGKGKKITSGTKVAMQYVGKLLNGKLFDKSKPHNPLKFTLGAGQVIPGMEQGVLGMNFGGKRIITIPPELGYGRKRIGEIPANSTLVFEIEILERDN
jgi:FK506-binding nuclear protein